MSDKIEKALERLNSILPLQENQSKLVGWQKVFHQGLLRGFVEYGGPLVEARMMEFTTEPMPALKALEEAQLLILNNGQIEGLYPFTTQERGFNVLANGWKVQAMCALDALSIVPMFNIDGIVQSECDVTKTPIMIEQFQQELLNTSHEYIHVGIQWSSFDETKTCADSLCKDMIFLLNTETATYWRDEDVEAREIFTLKEAIQLGTQFFKPLMDK